MRDFKIISETIEGLGMPEYVHVWSEEEVLIRIAEGLRIAALIEKQKRFAEIQSGKWTVNFIATVVRNQALRMKEALEQSKYEKIKWKCPPWLEPYWVEGAEAFDVDELENLKSQWFKDNPGR